VKRFVLIAVLSGLPLAAAPNVAKKDPNQIGGRKVASGLNFYSLQRELALGKQLSEEIRKQARLVEDPIVTEYINRIGQNLARNSDVTFPVTFNLIESDEIGAFTLPGGFIYVNTATLKISDNEAELASVIAHELGHAAARHATRQASQEQILNVGAIPLSIFGGIAGAALRQLGAPLAFFHFSRAFETEADFLGIQYLWKSGYDPEASVNMFERVEATERARPGAVSQLFRTHPMTAERIAKTQRDIGQVLPDRAEYVLNTSDYEEIRVRLNDLLDLQKAKDAAAPQAPTLRRPNEIE
jgi:predicted Zn-dependent protease